MFALLWCVEIKNRLEGSSESSDGLALDRYVRTLGMINGDLRRADGV